MFIRRRPGVQPPSFLAALLSATGCGSSAGSGTHPFNPAAPRSALLPRLLALGCLGGLLIVAACGTSVDAAGSSACRADCSSAHADCFNGCNSTPTPPLCQTGCGNEQLVCRKDCEGRFPQSNDSQCRADCSEAHADCFNGCNSTSDPATCQTGCSSEQLACQKDCMTRYPE